MDVSLLRELEKTIAKDIPEFQVGFKDESTFLKVLGVLAYPFNPNFMTSYTTTLGKTVYFPTRAFYETEVESSFNVLTHEYVHLWDKKQNGLFELLYAFPQLLVLVAFGVFAVLAWPYSWLLLLPIIGYVLAALVAQKSMAGFVGVLGVVVLGTAALAVWLTGWVALALLAALVCLAPWPSPARTTSELRGYTMSVAIWIWRGGSYSSEVRDGYVEHFVGPDYYFMSWSRASIEKAIDDAAEAASSGALQGRSPPYATIYDFLYQHSLLRR